MGTKIEILTHYGKKGYTKRGGERVAFLCDGRYSVIHVSLAEIRYLVKEICPFFYNLFITSLDNSENVLQNMRVDMRIIMSQEAFGLFSLDQK